MSDYNTFTLEHPQDGVALLTLNRPDRLNAITFEMFDEMHEVCRELTADTGTRVLIITGKGRGFCSGLDLDEARIDGADFLERHFEAVRANVFGVDAPRDKNGWPAPLA